MKPWILGIYAIVVAAAVCLIVLLTQPGEPDAPSTPTTVPTEPSTTAPPPAELDDIRLYQCDLALAASWKALAQRYTAETGITVSILTAKGDCTEALTQCLSGSNVPTIFCLHHSYEAALYRDQCLDLTGSAVADALCQDIFALTDGDAILGVAGNIESYGIVYNSKLLADAGYTISDITDFASLSDVVRNITANKRKLGFSAFAAPDLHSTDHGSLLCLLAGLTSDEAALRSFWDLYTANNTRSGASLVQALEADGLEDFQNGKAVFYLSGTWNYENFYGIEDYYLGMLPVYTPDSGSNPGLHHAASTYWCVNSQVSQEEQNYALDFLSWLVTAGEDGSAPVDDIALLTPYADTIYAGNPLEQLVLQYLRGENNVDWNSCEDLSPELLEQFGSALIDYTLKPSDETWAAIAGLRKT